MGEQGKQEHTHREVFDPGTRNEDRGTKLNCIRRSVRHCRTWPLAVPVSHGVPICKHARRADGFAVSPSSDTRNRRNLSWDEGESSDTLKSGCKILADAATRTRTGTSDARESTRNHREGALPSLERPVLAHLSRDEAVFPRGSDRRPFLAAVELVRRCRERTRGLQAPLSNTFGA